jgi:hypothetical protein
MTYKKSSFQDASMGLSYEAFLTRSFSLTIGLDVFRKSKAAYYKDWIGNSLPDGDFAFPSKEYRGSFEIKHSVTLASAPISLSVKWAPLGRRGNIIPYVGGGVNATIWNVKMQGDLVDFNDPYLYSDPFGQATVYPVYSVYTKEADGFGRVSWGWQAFGGVMIPVGARMTADVGAQYLSVPAEFNSGFIGFQPIDVGGLQIFVGINYWF